MRAEEYLGTQIIFRSIPQEVAHYLRAVFRG